MHTVKSCPICAISNPGGYQFCPVCGGSLLEVAAVAVPPRVAQNTVSLPDYLRKDYGQKRRYESEGSGSGLIWFGLLLILIPALTSNMSPVTVGGWALGLLFSLAGFIGLRKNNQGLHRAGLLTIATAVMLLGVVGADALRINNRITDAFFPFNAPGSSVDQEIVETAQIVPVEIAESGADVAMERGSATHSGVMPGPGPVGNPYRSWRYDIGGPSRSTPVVANGVVYTGGFDGSLHAIELGTGKSLWNFPAGDYPIQGSPAVHSGLVFVCAGFNLFALDAETGVERWRAELTYVGEASPVIANDTVYVASRANLLYAINLADGTRRWQFKVDGLMFAPPTIAEDIVVFGADSGKLYALDDTNGRMKWLLDLGGGVYATTASVGNVVYAVTSDQTTHAVNITNGKSIWTSPVGGDSAAAVTSESLILSSPDGGIYSLSTTDQGEVNWLSPLGSTTSPLAPVIAQRIVYASAGQNVYALNIDDGDERWNYPLGDLATTAPVVVDGLVLVTAKDGFLYAIAGDGVVPEES